MKISDAQEIICKYMREIKDAPCSVAYHLNIKGGLIIHLNNAFKTAIEFFPNDETVQALALVHDIGKARVYTIGNDNMIQLISSDPAVDHINFTIKMINDAGYRLTHDEENAIIRHHGGFGPFNNIDMREMAVKLHFCDMIAMIRERCQ